MVVPPVQKELLNNNSPTQEVLPSADAGGDVTASLTHCLSARYENVNAIPRIPHLTPSALARDLRQALENKEFRACSCQGDRRTRWVT
jgi:hypothetical protein